MSAQKKSSFFRNNGLTIVVVIMMLGSMCGQYITGWKDYNEERGDRGQAPVSAGDYFTTGHFVSATFENWESEFLQMSIYVLLTVWLYQKGSSESKDPDKAGGEEVEREPVPHPGAPWPVGRGGFVLAVYKNSLTIALFILFALSCSARGPIITKPPRHGASPLHHWQSTWAAQPSGLNPSRTGKVNF